MGQRLLRGEKLLGTVLEQVARQRLAETTDLRKAAELIRGLRTGQLFEVAAGAAMKRLAAILEELPGLLERSSRRMGPGLEHLFTRRAPVEDNRRMAHRVIMELQALVKGPDAKAFFSNPGNAQRAEKVAHSVLARLADDVDAYQKLADETQAFNALVQCLYPKDYASLRLDAHHIIEGRTYDKFKDAWKLLGWNSAGDMAALPLMHELHIRTPKNLPGLQKLARRKDYVSLSTELLREIDPEKISTAEELISKYQTFYKKTQIWDKVEPVLEAVERELTRQRNRAKLVQQAKKLGGTK